MATPAPPAPEPHVVFVKLMAQLIGVGAGVVLAGFNDELGRVIMWLMIGFALIWLYLNIAELQSILGKVPVNG